AGLRRADVAEVAVAGDDRHLAARVDVAGHVALAAVTVGLLVDRGAVGRRSRLASATTATAAATTWVSGTVCLRSDALAHAGRRTRACSRIHQLPWAVASGAAADGNEAA